MNRVGVAVLLMSGRTLIQGRNMEIGKLTDGYRDAVAYCELDVTVLETLGISAGDPVELETLHGQVIVKSKKSRTSEPQIAFVPTGPYYNALLDSDTQESGMPNFKGIEAKVFAASGKSVTPLRDLLKMGGT
ncbi:MAG: tRNA CCA-pyrophosphorylase [Candidatus Thorarchaeota archaeon]|nr:tRNA CCA-pyrophosphorylase [Candidatus Thorarchaeota archaeon]